MYVPTWVVMSCVFTVGVIVGATLVLVVAVKAFSRSQKNSGALVIPETRND